MDSIFRTALANLDDGKLAFENGQYATALSILLSFAEQGDPESQCMVGNVYELGLDTHPNLSEAVKWYLKSANQGYAIASNNLATIFQIGGEDCPINVLEAEQWLRKAIEQGFMHSPSSILKHSV
jgi:TPR repeat protein